MSFIFGCCIAAIIIALASVCALFAFAVFVSMLS